MKEDNTQYINDEWNIEKKYSKEEIEKVKIKNNKPDGRRYKK